MDPLPAILLDVPDPPPCDLLDALDSSPRDVLDVLEPFLLYNCTIRHIICSSLLVPLLLCLRLAFNTYVATVMPLAPRNAMFWVIVSVFMFNTCVLQPFWPRNRRRR